MAIIAPTVDSVGDAALTDSIIDKSITELQDDIVAELKAPALYGCKALKKVVFGSVVSVAANVFQNCSVLEVADFHKTVTITSGAFSGCTALAALILRSATKCTLSSATGLGSTGISAGTGYIYVPSALVDTYKADSKWGTYAAQIRAIEDSPDVCGYLGKVFRVPDKDFGSVSSGSWLKKVGGVWFVDTGFRLFRSDDCKTWDGPFLTRGSGVSYQVGVYWVNGLWIAAHQSTGLYYSEDSKSWTRSNITSGAHPSGTTVHFADDIYLCRTSSSIYYSEDGKTWSQSNISSSAPQLEHFPHLGLWVGWSTSTGFWYSEDGKTWTQSNITTNGGKPQQAFGVLVAGSASGGFYFSEDGKTWTQSNITTKGTDGIVYENGILVAHSGGAGAAYYSEDGKVWKESNITRQARGVQYVGGMWFAAQGSDNYTTTLWYSEDGKTWTRSNFTGANSTVYFLNGVYLHLKSAAGLVYLSTDGKTWQDTGITGYNLYQTRGRVFAVPGSSGNTFMVSRDGFSWAPGSVVPHTEGPSGTTHIVEDDDTIVVWSWQAEHVFYSTVDGE